MAKKSKRLLSILLSAVMVISSLPLVAITAFADTDSDKATLQEAMDQYKQKMDGTFYTNMSDAYSKFVTANEVMDIYDATGYDVGMAKAATDLNYSMAQMGTFTSKQGTVLGKMVNDDSYVTEDYYKQIYQNILYSPTCDTHAAQSTKTTYGSAWNGSSGATWYVSFPTTVMLYDGITTPQTAIMTSAGSFSTGTWNANNVRDLGARIDTATSQGLTLPGDWHGYDTRDRNFMFVWFANKGNNLPLAQTGNQYYSHKDATTHAYANLLQFTGSFTNGTYSKAILPTFTFEGANDKGNATVNATSNKAVYVINYKALIDAANTNKEKIILKGAIKSYEHGGLSAVLRAYETAMSVDPTAYDYSNTETAVNNCSNAIKSAVDGLNNATTTADGTGYDNLIKALQNARNDYNAGITDPEIASAYADGVWDTFKTAYEEAVTIFENLKTTGYNDDNGAQLLANKLTAAKNALVAVDRVDASALIIAIDNAEAVIAANKYFTADSYAATNAVAIVKAAKEAVWGSVDNYGVSAKLPADSESARAAVKAQADIIRAALMNLKIDKDAVVIASGQSYNSAVIEANKYLAHAEDYSNAAKLQEALDAASVYANDDTLYLDASIEGHAHFVIDTYASGVNGIMFAIQSLNPSFSKITDGTFATLGDKVTTTIDSNVAEDGKYTGYWQLDFSRYTGSIIFKTDHTAKDYDLPDAQFAWKTNRNFDQLLDSININADSDLQAGELISISSSQAITDNAKGWALNGDQTKTYTGLLGMTNGGLELSFHDIYCSGYNGAHGQIGYTALDEGGNRTTIGFDQMSTYKWDDDLLTTEGTEPFSGGVTAKSPSNSAYGATTLNSKMTIATKATSSKLFDTDKATGDITGLAGSVKLSKFDTSNSSSYIAMTYSWAHHPFNYWHGYSYDRAQYVQQIYVVDIASLLDLISYVEGLDPTQYSNSSWAALTEALIAAKDEMPYAGMTADEIYNACDVRLQNLYNALINLETPANNNAIKEIIEMTSPVYRTDETKCEATTWAEFTKEYQALYKEFTTGKYSDKNVRDYGVSDQDIIDAAAEALKEAYNNLVRFADFSPVKNAIALLGQNIANEKYTATELDALKTVVANYSTDDWFQFYINNKAAVDAVIDGTSTDEAVIAQMQAYYKSNNANFADSQTSIDASATGIFALLNELGDSTVDTSVLEASIAKIYDQYTDPDAWDGIEEAVAAIRNMNLYADYDFFGVPKKVFKFETTDEVDVAVKELLEGDYAVTKQKYEVKLVDANGATIATKTMDFGTKAYVTADGEISDTEINSTGAKADWYYSYKSNTAQNSEKFISTDTFLAFIVKGNTVIRMQPATNADKVRVNYVNNLNGQSYKIDYVDAGTVVTPAEAPVYHNYQFVNYTVDGEAVSDVTVTKDTVIKANYVYAEAADTFTVTLGNMGGSFKLGTPIAISGLKYNDLITVDPSQINKIDTKDTAKVSYTVNGETREATFAKKNNTPQLKLTYWVAVDPEYIDAWMAQLNNTSAYNKFVDLAGTPANNVALQNSLHIIGVGDKLNYRVHEDALIMPLAKQDYDALTSSSLLNPYIADRDTNNVTVYSRADVVKNDDSFSIISNYSLPEGATMVETGILFQSNGNATDTSTPLTFNNVGKALNGDTKAVARMKSTQHTAGNQYVITIGASKLKGVGVVKMRYAAYIIYEIDGVQYSAVQPVVDTSVNF